LAFALAAALDAQYCLNGGPIEFGGFAGRVMRSGTGAGMSGPMMMASPGASVGINIAAPLRATGRLLWSFDLYRRDKHHYRSPDAGQSAAADRTIRHQLVFRAADRLDLVATFAIVRFHRPFQPAQGILRRFNHAG